MEKLDWMDASTKARAAEKLKALAYLIGYPKKWKSYDFAIKPKSYVENALAARAWDLKRAHRARWASPSIARSGA